MDIIFSWIFDIANDISWWYVAIFIGDFWGIFEIDLLQSVSMHGELEVFAVLNGFGVLSFLSPSRPKWDSFPDTAWMKATVLQSQIQNVGE